MIINKEEINKSIFFSAYQSWGTNKVLKPGSSSRELAQAKVVFSYIVMLRAKHLNGTIASNTCLSLLVKSLLLSPCFIDFYLLITDHFIAFWSVSPTDLELFIGVSLVLAIAGYWPIMTWIWNWKFSYHFSWTLEMQLRTPQINSKNGI